jgi:glutathionyl-hydroquinone reductase
MSISSLQPTSILSKTYFSEDNIYSIQQQIRYKIFLMSNEKHTIPNQDSEQLTIVMRSIFLQFALNKPDDILNQVLTLNQMVIDYCANQIWVEIKQYIGYLRDIDQGMVPIDREMNLSKDSQILVNNKIGFNDDDIPIGSLL